MPCQKQKEGKKALVQLEYNESSTKYQKSLASSLLKKSFLLLVYLSLFLLFCCRSTNNTPTVRQRIDALTPDSRILQAEQFFREDDQKWALYAWNQTQLEDLVSNEARETYRLLKHWLFVQPVDIASLENMQISAMYLDYDDLWLGTWNGGIYRLSLSSGENFILEQDTPSLVPKVVYRIRKSGNAFWFAMHQGLRFYNYQTGLGGWLPITLSKSQKARAISDFLENSNGLFVSSLTHGVQRRTIEGNTYSVGTKTLKRTIVALEYEDSIGLLIGTAQQGAYRWKDGVIEALEKLQPIFRNLTHVNHIVNDGTSLWFASSGEGLFRWNYLANESYQLDTESSILRSNRISALFHSGDWLFIGDEKGGIFGYHLPEKKWYIWDNGRNLEFISISALAYSDGKLFYSTLAGGVYQIHWLKYLFALKAKENR